MKTEAKARTCTRCGATVAETPSGHLRAHACPHGKTCVATYAKRREGDRPKTCMQCHGARNLLLPGVE
jgi:hypothetical protein